MKKYQIDQIEEALDALEGAIIRNGLARKNLLDLKSMRNAIVDLRKRADRNELRSPAPRR